MGDLVLVTLEGADPAASFGQLMSSRDDFSTWFLERASAIHGIDLTAPMPGPLPELVIDSQ